MSEIQPVNKERELSPAQQQYITDLYDNKRKYSISEAFRLGFETGVKHAAGIAREEIFKLEGENASGYPGYIVEQNILKELQ